MLPLKPWDVLRALVIARKLRCPASALACRASASEFTFGALVLLLETVVQSLGDIRGSSTVLSHPQQMLQRCGLAPHTQMQRAQSIPRTGLTMAELDASGYMDH